jgi:hypothetical protein
VVEPVPLIVPPPFHVRPYSTVTLAKPVSVPPVKFKCGIFWVLSKSALPPLMVTVPPVIAPVTVVVPPAKMSVPPLLMAEPRDVTPALNCSAPTAGTTKVPLLSLPPPCKSRMPELALTVPVLLNRVK